MKRILIAATALLALTACKNENEFTEWVSDPFANGGLIEGRVCNAETGTWYEGVTVYTHLYDEEGVVWDTRITESDEDGWWSLDPLQGDREYDIYYQVGNEIIDQFMVGLPPNKDLILDEPECFEAADFRAAVVTGDYDDFGVLFETLGISEYLAVNGQTGDEMIDFLTDLESMNDYAVIFFDGGHLEEGIFYDSSGMPNPTVDLVLTTLQQYVFEGGVVYASDWAYDVVERAWPDQIDFVGDDTVPDAGQVGETDVVLAKVLDSGLETTLGADTISITYDMFVWPVVEDLGPGSTAYLVGDAPYTYQQQDLIGNNSPLLVGFESGEGSVVFSTWRSRANAGGEHLKTMRYLLPETTTSEE